MSTLEIRPGRPEDMEARYGDEGVGVFWAGLSAERNGILVGIGGVAWIDGHAQAFLDLPLRYMPRAIRASRLARRVLAAAFAAGEEEIFALPDSKRPQACRWLKLLGFEFRRKDGSFEVWSCRR